jgi:hypothetical protein
MSPEAIELLIEIILRHGRVSSDFVKRVKAVYMPDGIAWLERYHDQTVQSGVVLNYPARNVQTGVDCKF